MSGQRFALIDPAAGVSGDMLLGALVELGAPPEWLRELPARLGVPEVEVEVDRVLRSGIMATKVTIRLDGATEGPGDVSIPDHGHHHHPHHGAPADHRHDSVIEHQQRNGHPHRHVGELLTMIARAPVSSWVKDRATAAFRLLAEAEGRIHGVDPEDVALHEVGAFDALLDVVGTIEGFERLGIDDVRTRPLALGSGWVRAAHGVVPVPAPVTSLLVEDLPIGPDGPVVGEATTPTGAALLRVLTRGPVPGSWRAVRTGWGAGTRDPEGYPNALRVVLAEALVEPADDLMVVATDVDDLNPEYLEPLREALVSAGAVDVQTWATQSKKGRVGFRVEALTAPDRVEPVTEAFFRHSGTAGVRRYRVERTTLAREQWELDSEDGRRVRIKTVHGPDGPRPKPEYDDVMEIARATGRPAHELARRYREEALRQVHADQGEIQHAHEKESPR